MEWVVCTPGPSLAAVGSGDLMGHTVAAEMTREQRLRELLATERETHELLETAARIARDPGERALFERLAHREEDALRELREEEERLDAEAFVQRALDC